MANNLWYALRETIFAPIKDLRLYTYWYSRFPNAKVCISFKPTRTTPLKVHVGKDTVASGIIRVVGVVPSGNFSLRIGARCVFSSPLTIILSNAYTYGMPSKRTGIRTGQVDIGNDVFIGLNSVILPNITIGDRATVGANSVVTKDVPPDAVVGGVPAKILHKNREYVHRNGKRMMK